MENRNENPKKNTNTKANVETKPPDKLKSISKTVPLVRQTRTSYKRMLRANPLLKYKEAGLNIDQLLGFKSEGIPSNSGSKEDAIPAVIDYKAVSSSNVKAKELKKPEVHTLKRTQSVKLPKSNGLDELRLRMPSAIISGNLLLTSNHLKKSTFSTSLSNNTAAKSKFINNVENREPVECTTKSKFLPKYSCSLKSKSETNTNQETESTNHKPKQLKKDISTLQRSLSSNDLPHKKDIVQPNLISPEPSTSQNTQNLNINYLANKFPDVSPIPITEGNSQKNFIFNSPSARERRSLSCSFTPNSVKKHSLLECSTPAFVERHNLQKKLIKWLTLRKKPISSIKHLRYFAEKEHDEDKENINIANGTSENHEMPKAVTTPDSSKVYMPVQNNALDSELSTMAKNAMVELQELIQENYPRAQCLGLLELIKDKYRAAEEEPEYWKCRAAIEQSVGNAVEFYKIAIVQGAEVSTVEKSLDQLLKKFCLLNISPNKSKQKKNDGNRTRIVREARNVFKSTIIQCAVHERKLKK